MQIYDILNLLAIPYQEINHKAVYTIEEALIENIPGKIKGVECKNLFVKGKKHFYLILLEAQKKANLKELAKYVYESKLSFASEIELKEVLGLEAGSVTPLGIIHDTDNRVIVLLDKELVNHSILVHPNVNTKTISIAFDNLIKIIDYTKHAYIVF